MAQSWSIIIIIIFFFFSVFPMYNTGFSAPEKVKKAFVGDSAVFPCNISKGSATIQDVDVHWRNSNDAKIFSIIGGKGTIDGQDPQYKNRVEYFPDKNNCSIKLNKLSKSDYGSYSGYISDPVNDLINIELLVEDKPEEKVNNGELAKVLFLVVLILSAGILYFVCVVFLIGLLRVVKG